jgi:DnaJ-class molecular chaperone
MNYKESECPRCTGERLLENPEDGTSAKCDLCNGIGVVGFIEEVINGSVVIKQVNKELQNP